MVEHDPTDIAGQEKARDDKADKLKRLAELEASDFKWVMSNPRGRRFVWRILEKAGVFRSSFTGNSETFFREGERNIGLQVLGLIHEHTPDAYTLMLQEQREHDNRNNQRPSKH